MKIKYLKLKNWLLVTLGGLLGINLAGCEKIFNTACEYGTPEATYHVLGTVTNADGQPIPGIGVGRYNPWDEEADTLMSARYHDTTDADGRYSVTYSWWFPGENIDVGFFDTDGTENGNYQDTIVTVKTSGVPTIGGDGWYDGEGFIKLDVTMKEKTDK